MDKQKIEAMAQTLEEMADAATKMHKILMAEVNALEQPGPPPGKEISYEVLHAAAMSVFQKEGSTALKKLLAKHSIKTLKELPKERYALFFKECNQISGVDYV